MNNEVTTKVVEVITQLQSVVKDNAADAVNLGLSVARVNGIGSIIEGIVCMILFCIGYFLTKSLYREDGDADLSFGVWCVVFLTGLCFVFAIFDLFYIWNWVAIFQPKLWLAHQILAKAVVG